MHVTKPLKMHVKLNLSENACETTVFSGLLVAPAYKMQETEIPIIF